MIALVPNTKNKKNNREFLKTVGNKLEFPYLLDWAWSAKKTRILNISVPIDHDSSCTQHQKQEEQ